MWLNMVKGGLWGGGCWRYITKVSRRIVVMYQEDGLHGFIYI